MSEMMKINNNKGQFLVFCICVSPFDSPETTGWFYSMFVSEESKSLNAE